MKICQYLAATQSFCLKRTGILIEDNVIVDPNLVWALYFQKKGHYHFQNMADAKMPSSLSQILIQNERPIELLQSTLDTFYQLMGQGDTKLSDGSSICLVLDNKSTKLIAPIDKITTYRDFFTHELHVATGFKKRNEPIPKAWYEMPVYYKGPTHGFIGPNETILWPRYSNVLDYELELAMVVANDGKNIKAKDAGLHIFGLTILNDISARDIQKKEMAVRLGPAKGKDFCSVIGPVITTYDEFNYTTPNLTMTAKINGKEWSRGQSAEAIFDFNDMIAHVSQDEWVLSGDLFGSGTVGTGCGLELDQWIQPGDSIELEIEKIGILKNIVGNKEGDNK